MTPTGLPPSHICPNCKEVYGEEAFTTHKGKRARWCVECRRAHRERLINLKAKGDKKLIKGAFKEMAAEVVAREEGYADHPLAALLALSHIAGAKRAIAIRDGKSWRGRKAWGEYYRAKRALEAALMAGPQNGLLGAWVDWTLGRPAKRDNNSDPVSSK